MSDPIVTLIFIILDLMLLAFAIRAIIVHFKHCILEKSKYSMLYAITCAWVAGKILTYYNLIDIVIK